MPSMTDITIRPVTDEEFPAFVQGFMDGFGNDVPWDGFVEAIRSTLPAERTLAAFDGDEIVGTFGGYDFVLSVPGGTVPMEGTTVVTVFPTHRRMGLMRMMMAKHLENAANAGYPVAGLWASESDIYRRFGFGVATHGNEIEMDGSNIHFSNQVPKGMVSRLSLDEAKTVLPPIYAGVFAKTPGMVQRSDAWWNNEVLVDGDWMKRGRSAKRIVVYNGADGPDGYAIYRQKGGHTRDGHANGSVDVSEVVAATPEADVSLWSYLAHIDGFPKVKYWAMPLDSSLALMVTEPRRVHTVRQSDALWVRILDVEAALSGRTYERDGSFVFRVVDPFRQKTERGYELSVSNGVGTCKQSGKDPVFEIDVDVLGALYLGGANALLYAEAGRIRGADAAVVTLHGVFRTHLQPWCPEIF
jgi:predicted acetyltransferase